MSECSTPYGIRESSRTGATGRKAARCTGAQRLTASENPAVPRGGPAGWTRLVLNALRHQRIQQLLSMSGPHPSFSCSTPYGIRESSSSRVAQVIVHGALCSTPYGIRESSRLAPGALRPRAVRVLNALRHQRIQQVLHPGQDVGPGRRAQRLTASENPAGRRVRPC